MVKTRLRTRLTDVALAKLMIRIEIEGPEQSQLILKSFFKEKAK